MDSPLTKLGIARCRDLVEVYLGFKIATFSKSTQVLDVSSQTQLLPANPARIRYEIILSDAIGGTGSVGSLGTQQDTQGSGAGEYIGIPPNGSKIIVRDFRSDGDAVTEAVWCNFISGAFSAGMRETILTPLPVDESP